MAETRAVVDVVRPDPRAHDPLQQVILLVRALGRREDGEAIGSLRVAQPRELLRHDLERFLPRALAERLVPFSGRRHAVARVAEWAVECRQLLAQRIELRPLLARARFAFDSAPRPTAPSPCRRLLCRRLEVPAAVALHPSLPDERLGDPVAVQHEVEAEASLHAGGAHVRSVLLDPWTLHLHDVVAAHDEVDLAADAAVRAHAPHLVLGLLHRVRLELREREDVVDRARRTDAHALAAPGAPRMLRIAIRTDDDLRVLPAIRDIEHAHHLDILARPHAPRAEDAGGHVVLDHGVPFALVAGAE